MLFEHSHVQLRGVPGFCGDLQRKLVSDLARGDSPCFTTAFATNALNVLLGQNFMRYLIRGFSRRFASGALLLLDFHFDLALELSLHKEFAVWLRAVELVFVSIRCSLYKNPV